MNDNWFTCLNFFRHWSCYVVRTRFFCSFCQVSPKLNAWISKCVLLSINFWVFENDIRIAFGCRPTMVFRSRVMSLGKIGPKVNHEIDHFLVIRDIVRKVNPMKIQPTKKISILISNIIMSSHIQRTHGNSSGSSSAWQTPRGLSGVPIPNVFWSVFTKNPTGVEEIASAIVLVPIWS